ncbi:hypothetical protein B5X24_HaOG203726 [Helicoverpa armigera]|uniref:Uncharacterized protein n=1 Tax=Helicoverpa armigera TaxID=29058 RepID=A0A2W1BPX6_HELAM|nr:hypothetical protein B5X24_HaOG203726 [Helicoverpa armigera]
MLLTYMLTCYTYRWNEYLNKINFGNNNDDVTVDREKLLDDVENVIESVNEAWNLILKTSGLFIFFHFTTTFVQTLVYVGVLIIWSKMHFVSIKY